MEDIYLIKVPMPGNPLKELNSYLIRGSERNLLIDTGPPMRACLDVLRAGLGELRVDMRDTDIFLTHMHYDHVGLASEIASEASRIYMSEADKRRLDNLEVMLRKDSVMQLRALAGMPVKQRFDDRFERSDFPPSRLDLTTLQDGYEFRIGRYNMRCIATPGHSPGHMCLYDQDAGILFSGDHVLFSVSPNITSWFESTDPLDDYLKSLGLVGNLKVKHTFCAHRGTSGDCSSRVSELIKHHADRLDEVLGIVKSSGSITAYDAASRMKWALSAVKWEDAPERQKMFAVGEAISHLEYIYNKNMTRRSLIEGSYRYSY